MHTSSGEGQVVDDSLLQLKPSPPSVFREKLLDPMVMEAHLKMRMYDVAEGSSTLQATTPLPVANHLHSKEKTRDNQPNVEDVQTPLIVRSAPDPSSPPPPPRKTSPPTSAISPPHCPRRLPSPNAGAAPRQTRTYRSLSAIWCGASADARPPLRLLLQGTDFVLPSLKPREKSAEKLREMQERREYAELVI
ncbi:hypothetical protein EJB05_05495, partial [Eragrostis curvula]